MNESISFSAGPLPRSWWRETGAPPTIGQFPNNYSSSISWLAGIFLVAAFTSVLLMASTTSKIDRIDAPEQALSLMVGRTMDAQEGLSRAPAWEQRMMRWVSGDGEAERTQAIAWYQELAARSDDPAVPLQLAILQAESGQAAQALLSAHKWNTREEPLPAYGNIIGAAYGEERPLDRHTVEALQSRMGDVLPVGWFYDRLMMRLAQRAGHAELTAIIDEELACAAIACITTPAD